MASSHADSRWSERRNAMRPEDNRIDYGGKGVPRPQDRQQHYDHYDPYDSTGENEYGSREYPDNYEQPNDLYENVPASRNIARIQITAEEEERRPQQRFRDYDQHTIDRPYKGEGTRRDERRMESQRRTEMERNAEKSRQQAENRRREEVEKARRADLEREEEKKRVEAERQRMAEERKRQEIQRKHQQQQQQQQQNAARREPHLRYEPSPVPYQGHKQGIIDGFQPSPNKQKVDYREEDYRPQNAKKSNEIPPAPPAPKSIRAIINNLKGNTTNSDQKAYAKDDGRNDIPRNKVSTNPFIRAGEKPSLSPARTPDQPIKNVQEVVQKMNSGEWPIRVEDEDQRMKNHLQMRETPRPRSQQSFDHPAKIQKTRQWEELDHHSPEHRNSRSDAHRRTNSVRDLVREADEEQRRHDSEFSERSDGAELTTVSTDSAMGSDENSYPVDKLALPFELPHGTVIRKLPANVKELNEEAEKLLIYFKTHRSVLNYLGIGLSETLWTHIHALPDANAEIVVELTRNSHHSPKKVPPQITVTQPIFSPKQRERSPEARTRGGQQQQPAGQQRPAQSPRMTALERQLCTDAALSPSPPSIDESLPPKLESARSGRFVKKSAAALIARKQGAALQSDDEPLSSDFVDNRIATEIEQLRAREDELRKSRSQLGLPTIEDVMDGGGQLYFDYQRQMPISRSQSAHAIYHDSRPSPSMNYFPNQREEYDENVTARVQRMREFEQKFERGEQFFRASENQHQLRQRSAISRVDITLSPSRASSPPRRGGKIGL